jgi:hypothetical protein
MALESKKYWPKFSGFGESDTWVEITPKSLGLGSKGSKSCGFS